MSLLQIKSNKRSKDFIVLFIIHHMCSTYRRAYCFFLTIVLKKKLEKIKGHSRESIKSGSSANTVTEMYVDI